MHKLNIYMDSPVFAHLNTVYGSEMPIELTVKDYVFGGDAYARAFARKYDDDKVYALPATVSGNVITITVPAGAIPAGKGDIQVEITEAGKKIVTFKIPTICEGSIIDGEVGEVEFAKTAAARAEAAAAALEGQLAKVNEIVAKYEAGELGGYNPLIISQPLSVLKPLGTEVAFRVGLRSTEGVKYQWQYSTNYGETWYNCTTGTYNTDTFSTSVKTSNDGRGYRCIVTGADGHVEYSGVAQIFIKGEAAAAMMLSDDMDDDLEQI